MTKDSNPLGDVIRQEAQEEQDNAKTVPPLADNSTRSNIFLSEKEYFDIGLEK